MGILRKEDGQQLIFESETEGVLVAIDKKELPLIKEYWKKYKGSKSLPEDLVKGNPFVFDEEQQSLKIDFSTILEYKIKELKKFS